MSTVTDTTYYTIGRKKQIPNLEPSSNIGFGTTKVNQVEEIIKDAERELLTNCLNVFLYDELQIALTDLPNADQKWKDLVIGVDYDKDGKRFRFQGLRGVNKESLVAYYVFCEYMQRDDSYYSTTGTVKVKKSGAVDYGGTTKYVNAWNTFIKAYQNDESKDSVSYLTDSYGCVVGIDYYKQDSSSGLVSLETYLNDHYSDFEGYNFKRYDSKNSLDI